MPLLTIDDIEIAASDGMTILEAASQAGIWIPTLCYYPKITPSDSCRMCVVEIEGVSRPMTSCNTLVKEGMRVHTDTPHVRNIREEVMKLVLMDHPLECPICPAAGECEIQNLTYRLGISGSDNIMGTRSGEVVKNWPLIQYNPNLCITCLRCVKVCHEVIGAGALALHDLGYNAQIGAKDGKVLNCDFCGECVEACPSGAMSYKQFKNLARSWELRKTETICPLCSSGCRMEMNVKDNTIVRITANPASHNKGTLCVGGRFGYDLIHSEERLVSPLLRKNGSLVPVFWEEGLSHVSRKLQRMIGESGPDSVAGLASPRLTNEDCYAFQKFFRAVIGTNNIDSEARFSFLRVQRALELTCGVKGVANKLENLLETEAVLVIGIDPVEETPALGWKIKIASRKYDSNVLVANSRETSLDPFARLRLRIRPYSESELALGMMKVILDLDLWDGKFVRDRTTNFLSMKGLLDKIPLKGILKRTGISFEELQEASRVFAQASTASIIFGGDVILQENGLQCVMNLVNLALLTGNMGQSGASIYPVFEKGNIVGLCDMGVMPEYMPGYQDMAEVRDLFEKTWKTRLPYNRGKTTTEIARGLEAGEIRALFLAGADPLTDYPNAGRWASALNKAELLVVHDMFLSPSAELAHCVFPVASFAEKEGTMTNIEHRVQRLNQVIPPLSPTMPDWSILEELARSMGKPMGFFRAADIFNEISRTVPLYNRLTLDDLRDDGKILNPFQGTSQRNISERPYSFAPVRTWEAPDREAAQYPYEMIVGRSMYHFGSTSTRSKKLLSLCPGGYVEINPEDATELGVEDGAPVEVASTQSAFVAPVKITSRIRRGLVFAPVNFPKFGVYRLFNENTNVCRVRLTAL
ncbi:MAG: molybdopterin-dependent oxidoreductase [Desulfomonilaceae bacterium]|jgi:formate dehydrogenase alpha subunit